MRRIGWIGLGRMGEPMARHLLGAGHALTVYNRSPARASGLADGGATVAATVAQAADGAEVLFCMVADDAALRATLLGAAGAISALSPGAVLVEMSTVSPAVSAEVAAAAAGRGIGYLRAPVSGSVAFAASAKLTVIASGPPAVYAGVLPLLQAMSARQFHVGGGCEARVLKLALNMMVGVSAAMMGEALAFGLKNGLARGTILDVIGASAVASPLIGYKLDMLRARDYAPAFDARMMGKDFGLLLAAAAASGVPVPVAEQAATGWDGMIANGDGDADFFKIVELAAARAGVSET